MRKGVVGMDLEVAVISELRNRNFGTKNCKIQLYKLDFKNKITFKKHRGVSR